MTRHLNLGPNDLEGLYIYGSGELDQLSPLQETTKEGEEILESPLPRKIPLHFISPIESIRTIKCGQLFTLILSTSGNVYTFGCADNASLGHADDPKACIVPLKFSVLGIGGGDCHGIAYDRENLAFWGQFRNLSGPIGEPCVEPNYFNRSQLNGEYFKKVICGTNHVIILTEEKNVYTFGNNEFGQLGINPDRIIHHFQINKLIYEKNVEDIFTGDDHSFLVKFENGIRVLKSWGNNIYGQLGIGAYNKEGNGTTKIYIPTKVIFPGYPNTSVKKVEGGANTSICISEDNRIFVWGYNDFSILGLQSDNKIIPNPKELVFFDPYSNPENSVDEIFACHQYFYAKNSKKNKIYSWGIGDSFTLGNKKEKAETTPYLINNLFFKNLYVEDLALGCYHVVVRLIQKIYEDKQKEEIIANNIEKIDIEKKEEKKAKKRKKDEFNEEKEEDNYGIKVGIKEEYITLNELDQPKFSKNYKFSKKESDFQINANLNKIVEEEKNKVKNIENESKDGKTNVKKNKQTPSKVKQNQNSKSKEKNKKIDEDIEMRDDTGKNSSKKKTKNIISLKKEKSEEKNKKNSASKNKRSTSKKENEEEIKNKKEEQDKEKEKKINLRKIDLSNKKEKSVSKKKGTEDKEKTKEEDKNKEKSKEKEKEKVKEKETIEEKIKESEKEKTNEKSKEKDYKNKSKNVKKKSSVSKEKEEKNNNLKKKEEKEEKEINTKKSKSKIRYPKEDNEEEEDKGIKTRQSKSKKIYPKEDNEDDKGINTRQSKSRIKYPKEDNEEEDKGINTRKSKSKVKYPKEDNEEKDDKNKKKKYDSQNKKSQKKEKKEEKEDENNENRRILRSSNKEKLKEKEKVKEKGKDKEKSKKSINSKSKERYPKRKK